MRLKDGLFRAVTAVHRAVVWASGGRLLGRLGGMPVIILTTTGHRSGKPRSTVLTAPVHDGNRIVLVASYGGDARHPKWFLNLRNNGEVMVTRGRRRSRMRARVASPAERSELWPRVVDANERYAAYQRRTARDIPLVILEPADGP